MVLQKRSLDLIEQVQKVIAEYDIGLTLRQIYYQLVARQIIKNKEDQYKRLSRLCVIGRDEGKLPEDAFTDRLRYVEKPDSWENLQDFFDTVKVAYRKTKWNTQNHYIEIWTEKDALREVFSDITGRYDVSLLVVRGQASRTAIYQALTRFRPMNDKEIHLLYFGDFDPSGLSIYNSISERLRGMGLPHLKTERIALTEGQIDEYDLPQDPAKKSDPNYKKFVTEYGDNVVELDALPPDALQEMIQGSIKKYLNKAKFEQVQEIERQEKVKIENMVNSLQDF